ncbi:YkgJ family cysteine cluster protein [Candidatus Bathyarchaeota archaeon]|nr:YkgJ family cysteine cluster protein [Candidatus Bathyarchaeota archaeon]
MSKIKKQLTDGTPCIEHNCILCCKNTEMPLTISDVERILKKGYKFQDFAVRINRETKLRNVDNVCFFLRGNRCKIYSIRPEGCKLYPLIYEEDSGECILDEICPYRDEFKILEKDVIELKKVIKKLEDEQK